MQFSSRGISLRQVVEDDLPFLFRLFSDPSRCHLWMQGRRVYDERGFQQAWIGWSSDMMATKFLIESGGRPIGLIFEYDRSLEDGYSKMTALLQDENVGHGGGVIATALLADWLFQTLPLRKIYMDVYGYNPRVVRMLRKLGLQEEAILKEMRFWNGSYWDVHMFAVRRQDMPDLRRRLLQKDSRSRRDVGSLGANGTKVNGTSSSHAVNSALIRVD